MPQELLKEFIGKYCIISVLGETVSDVQKIIAIDGNWIKTENNKNKIRLINGDMIKDIQLAPEKYNK